MNAAVIPDMLAIARRDIQRVMSPADYLHSAEQAFRAAASGRAHSPPPMHLPVERGGFHAKGASIALGRNYVAVKLNGNFPGNPVQLGLPTIQGAILLADGHNGALLAVLDSIEVTLQRTAAASALAARLLARPDSRTLLLCGCGAQGRAHVEALRAIMPIRRWLLWDRDRAAAEALAVELADGDRFEALAVRELGTAARQAEIIVTCTTAVEPFLDAPMIEPGTFIAAVGADSPAKSEMAPGLMAAATVVVDSLAQCAEMGDLHHAIAAGAMTESDVHAELSEVVVEAKPARRSEEEIIIFDSTGTGVLDVAACATIYQRCSGDSSIPTVALTAP